MTRMWILLLVLFSLVAYYTQANHVEPQSTVPASIETPNLDALNRIRSLADAHQLRESLYSQVMPDVSPALVTESEGSRFLSYPSVEKVERIVTLIGFDITSTAALLYPVAPNGRLVIYHTGHGQTFLSDQSTALVIKTLLPLGFHVLLMDMPVGDHAQFQSVKNPLKYFLGPVRSALDYAVESLRPSDISMIGLSGGGWTTVVYCALDTRIKTCVPVAGSWPMYLRKKNPASTGDFEQQLPGLDASYIELYLLGASERREVQIFHLKDPCCFSEGLELSYSDYVRSKAVKLDGKFAAINVDLHVHMITDIDIELILSVLNDADYVVGANDL